MIADGSGQKSGHCRHFLPALAWPDLGVGIFFDLCVFLLPVVRVGRRCAS